MVPRLAVLGGILRFFPPRTVKPNLIIVM